MYSLKIVNGRFIDLDSGIEKYADIGIKDGKIHCIGSCPESSKAVIDVNGKMVAPGFIDIHMHEEVIGETVDGDDYDIANRMLLMGVTTCAAGNCGNNRQSIEEFFGFIDNHGAPVNYLSFIGHNFLRNLVGNNDRYRKSTKMEIEKIKELAASSIELGAIGMSFGLEYSPGTDFDEVIQVCDSIKEDNTLLSAHYRKDAKFGIDAINEMIEISKVTGLPMQISHLGSCTAYGMMGESLAVIDRAIKQGADISADCYPYDAFSTFIGSAVFDEGCFELWNKSYDSILLTEGAYTGVHCNKEIFEKVRKEHPDMLVVAFVMNEDEVVEALQSPFVMVASDGLYRKGQGHPRGAGTFPRVLGKYVRDMNKLTLMDALRKMTVLPAKRLGLRTKGYLKEGFDADIVIFDPDAVMDGATFETPITTPVGISHVIIDGKIAVENNIICNSRLGKVIRRNELNRWRESK